MSLDLCAYNTLLDRLFNRFPSVQTSSFDKAYKPGLQGIEHFDEMLNHPHKSYSIIHVAGTNGKGSVTNMLASVLSESGYKVGVYTSPHLHDFRERAKIIDSNGELTMVSEQYVYDFLTRYWSDFDKFNLSFFEITTSLAFQWFKDENVDWAVIEVGLGGRLDSTNIVSPKLSVITSIGLDHCAMLGDSLDKIAFEKAGIIKYNTPVVVGHIDRNIRYVFENKANTCHSSLSFVDDICPSLNRLKGEILENLDLKGEYQSLNVDTALCSLEVLINNGLISRINDDIICNSLTHTAQRLGFRGRWEIVSNNPCIICDIGHNSHALKHNFSQLTSLEKSYDKLIIVFGIMADKNLDDILPLFPKNAFYILTTVDTKRALDVNSLRLKFLSYFGNDFESQISVAQNLKIAIGMAKNLASNSSLIYIGGSNFIVSEALKYLP